MLTRQPVVWLRLRCLGLMLKGDRKMKIEGVEDIEKAIDLDRESRCSDCSGFVRQCGQANLRRMMEWWLSEELHRQLGCKTYVESYRTERCGKSNTGHNFQMQTRLKPSVGVMLFAYHHDDKNLHYQMQIPHPDLKTETGDKELDKKANHAVCRCQNRLDGFRRGSQVSIKGDKKYTDEELERILSVIHELVQDLAGLLS